MRESITEKIIGLSTKRDFSTYNTIDLDSQKNSKITYADFLGARLPS